MTGSSSLANNVRSGGFVDWLLEREDVQQVWKEFTHHEFVEKMGDGTLPVERFKFYMVQDYLYLVRFAIIGVKTILTSSIDAICQSQRTCWLQGQDPRGCGSSKFAQKVSFDQTDHDHSPPVSLLTSTPRPSSTSPSV